MNMVILKVSMEKEGSHMQCGLPKWPFRKI